MRYITGTTRFHLEGPGAVSLGKFDGMHRGHQKLLDYVLAKQREGMNGIFFTFDQFPGNVLEHRQMPLIMTNEERRLYLERSGLDVLIECPFVKEVIHLSPEDFVREILIGEMHARYVVMGTDFHFGYKAAGDAEFLVNASSRYGFTAEVIDKVMYGNEEISSTLVRSMITQGKIKTAHELLGRPYNICGNISRTQDTSEKTPFPVIRVIPHTCKLMPPDGVYISICCLNGKALRSVTNISSVSKKNENDRMIQTHLFDCCEIGDGSCVEIELYDFIRPEQKFATVEALTLQIQQDILLSRDFFSE